MVWLRSAEQLPSDPVLNVCILTYFSDLNMVGTVADAHGGYLSAASAVGEGSTFTLLMPIGSPIYLKASRIRMAFSSFSKEKSMR